MTRLKLNFNSLEGNIEKKKQIQQGIYRMKWLLPTALMTLATLPVALFSELTTLDDYYKIAQESCHSIPDVRVQIDRINNEILQLLTERTAYVKRAGDIKATSIKIANDPQRVAAQEQNLIDRSDALKLPTKITIPTFRALVNASIEYEQDYMDCVAK